MGGERGAWGVGWGVGRCTQLANLNAFYLSDNQLTGVVPKEVMAQVVYTPQWSVCDNEVLSTNMTNTRLVVDSNDGVETNETFHVWCVGLAARPAGL
jgi:hypothetical protein